MSNSEVFLQIAKNDLKSAQYLYQSKLYPQAVFFLQQSVEKMTKAFGSLSSDIPLDTLKREVGHFPFRVFIYSLQQFAATFKAKNGVASTDSAVDMVQHNQNNFISEVQKADQIYRKLEKIDGLSSFILGTQLSQILTNIRNLHTKIELDSEMEDFIVSIEKFLKQQHGKTYTASIDMICSLLRRYMHNIMQVMGPLAFLVLILPASCVQNTRYPSDKSNPLEIYVKDHPLIKSFDNIMEICLFVSKHMVNVFKMFEEFERIGEQVGSTNGSQNLKESTLGD